MWNLLERRAGSQGAARRPVLFAGLLACGIGTVLLVQACSDTDMVTPEDDASSVQILANLTAASDGIRADSLSFGKQHNAYLDSLLVQVKEYRRAQGLQGPMLTTTLCNIVKEYVSSRGHNVRAAHAKGRCDFGSAGGHTTALSTMSPTASSGSWTPVDWVDSLVLQTEAWDEAEFEGPSSADYAAFMTDAIGVVEDALNVSSGTYSSYSEFEGAVLGAVASLNPIGDEAQAIMAEVATLGIESGEYWVENGDEWYEEVCDEGGGELSLAPGAERWFASLRDVLLMESALGEVPDMCQEPENVAQPVKAQMIALPSFPPEAAVPAAATAWGDGWQYLAVGAADVAGALVGGNAATSIGDRLENWAKGELADPDNASILLDAKGEVIDLPGNTEVERATRRKAFFKAATKWAVKRLLWVAAAAEAGVASYLVWQN